MTRTGATPVAPAAATRRRARSHGRWSRRAFAVTVVTTVLASFGAVAGAQPTRSAAETSPAAGPPVRFVVALHDDAAGATLRSATATGEDVLANAGARVVRRFRALPFVTVEAPAGAAARLRALPGVAAVAPDTPLRPALADSTGLVGATTAHAGGVDGTGTAVAVLDTGVDRDHPFLAGRVVGEACFSVNRSCPNGQASQTGAGSGVPCTFAAFECQHGTHVAGIAAGDGDTFDGMAPGADVLSVMVFTRATGLVCQISGASDPCAISWISDQLAGLDWVYAQRAQRHIAAVNMSIGGIALGGTCDSFLLTPVLKPAIDRLRSAGIMTVVAAGNEGSTTGLSFPSCISSAVAVGATTKSDTVASYSNSAPELAMWAPGSSITSSVPGGGFATFSGTSMAAPHAAGALALLHDAASDLAMPQPDLGELMLSRLRNAGPFVLDSRNGVNERRIDVVDAVLADPPLFADAAAADGGAVVQWLPASDGVVTGFRVTASPGGATVEVGPNASQATVTGLTAGESYTFTVTALSALGPGAPSAPTNAVVPTTTLVPYVGAAVESAGTLQIPVFLTAPSSSAVTATLTTVGFTATAGADFTAASIPVQLDPGQQVVLVPVALLDDALDEPNELLVTVTSNVVNANVGGWNGLGVGIVVDDDPAAPGA